MDRSDFGKRLKKAREEAGLTQTQLGKAVGISQGNIAELEKRGKSSFKTLELAAACNVDPGWLATGVGGGRVEAAPKAIMSPGAIELAALYDLIPQSDKIGRARAYSGASAAILEVLQQRPSTEPTGQDQQKQSD